MADEAGPSGTGTGRLSDEKLAEVESDFQKGVQCIKDNNINDAVKIFSDVLKHRVKHYGEIAPECASAYYRYGSALLYQAQDSADVFGGPLREQEEGDKENGLLEGTDGGDKGDKKAEEEDVAADEADEQEMERAAVEGGDLQLAWENLETARAIWARDSKANADPLASVHMLLGDVNMENEAFEDALTDYDAALEHQAIAGYGDDDRRGAEVHFKRSSAAQFLGRIDAALEAVRTAVSILTRHKAGLSAKEWATEETKEEAIAGVDAVLEELNDKEEELETTAQEEESTKAAMRGAMSQLTAIMAQQNGHAPAGGDIGSNTNANAGAASGRGPDAAARPPGASPVKDLGVVGRGTKRINLAPLAEGGAAGASTAAPAGPQPKKKRSLEDLMGSAGEGETTIGFGGASEPEKQTKKEENAPAAAAPANPEEAALPAFLQAYTKK